MVQRILLVNNDTAFAAQAAGMLREAGFDVTVAVSGMIAAEVGVRIRPDLIVLDADMPRYSGLEFHECMQYSRRLRDVPVVYFVEADNPVARTIALEHGARAFLTRPCTPAELLKTVRGILRPAHARRTGQTRTLMSALEENPAG